MALKDDDTQGGTGYTPLTYEPGVNSNLPYQYSPIAHPASAPSSPLFPPQPRKAAASTYGGQPGSGSVTQSAGKPSVAASNPTGQSTYTQPAEALAQQIIDNFEAAIDWAPGFDSTAMMKQILSKHLEIDPNAAYSFLYGTLSQSLQQQYQGAQFGWQPDAYQHVKESLGTSFYDITGQELPSDVLVHAIQMGWTTSDLQTYVMDLALRGGGPGGMGSTNGALPSWLDLSASPWLLSGVTYQSAAQSMQQAEPGQKMTQASVASFWRFTTAAHQIGTSQAATTQLGQQLRSPSSEVR